jgi:hypothetical protein
LLNKLLLQVNLADRLIKNLLVTCTDLALQIRFLNHVLLKAWLKIVLDVVTKLVEHGLAYLLNRLVRVPTDVDIVLFQLQHLFPHRLELIAHRNHLLLLN